MLRSRFGDEFSEDMIHPLREIQGRMLARKAELEQLVENDEMTVAQFGEAINSLLTDHAPSLAEILGVDNFRSVFGMGPDEEVYLLDIEIAAREDKE